MQESPTFKGLDDRLTNGSQTLLILLFITTDDQQDHEYPNVHEVNISRKNKNLFNLSSMQNNQCSTYQKHYWRTTDESNGSAQFPFIASAISSSWFVGVLLQSKVVDSPISYSVCIFWRHTAKFGVEYQVLTT